MNQESLIKSFNTDFFLRYNTSARIKIQAGYENCVFVNGHSLGGGTVDGSLNFSLYTFDSSRTAVDASTEVVDVHIEPSNESVVTYVDGSEQASYDIVDDNIHINSVVKILQDTRDSSFYVKGKTGCDKILKLKISSSTDTSVFSKGFRKIEKGRIVKLIGETQPENPVLVTLIDTENLVFSGLKYIGGTLTVAIDSSAFNRIGGEVKSIIVNPREIDGDLIEGKDERTVHISEQIVNSLSSFTVNLTSDGEHDQLDETVEQTALIEGESVQYDFKTIYQGELYTTELYTKRVENKGDYILIISSINNTQAKTVDIDSSAWVENVTDNFIHVHIDSNSDFWFKYVTCKDGEDEIDEENYEDYEFKSGWNYEQALSRPEKLIGEKSSFALLRANPKLTGNIKVVVDSKENLYLDTFKVSNTLSNSAFRKISIDSNEYYGRAVMKKFRNVSSEEIFKVENYCYDVFSYATSLADQYYDMYNYGVRTNSDKMYPENFSFLAPLKVKKVLPDFFVIFKVKPNENGKYYDDTKEYSTAEHIKYFLENGEVIKTYDMRKGSILGDYVRKFYNESKGYSGDCYVTYDYLRNNTFNGISIDRGVVIQAHESNALTRDVLSQSSLNDWLTLGFERNRLVSKDILNLEFMFDDVENQMFSVNTYFGLYIRLNGEAEDFSCIDIVDGIPIFDYNVTGKIFNVSENKNLIYGISTPDKFERLQYNIQSIDASSKMSTYMRKPYQNVAHVKVVNIDDESLKNCSYASIKFDDVLDPGEHFRIINVNKNTGEKDIYEVIISNTGNAYFDISEVHHSVHKDFKIHTLAVYKTPYRSEVEDNDKGRILSEELEKLSAAFNSFSDDIECVSNGADVISIIFKRKFEQGTQSSIESLNDYILIEKVTSIPGINDKQIKKQNEYKDISAKIFGFDDLSKIYVNSNDNSYLSDILYPFGFEISGRRVCYVSLFTRLVRDDSDENFSTYLIESDISNNISKYKTVLFKVDDGQNFTNEYDIYNGFNISKITQNGRIQKIKALAIPGFANSNSYLVKFYEIKPEINGGYLNFFSSYPINAGLCSIFSIKDPYTDILDVDNKLNGETVSDYAGEYNEYDVYGNRCYTADSSVSEDSILDYFDKYKIFERNEEMISGTLFDDMKKSKKNKSDIPLLFNYCCKFKALGTDKSGNRMRIMFDIENPYRNVIDFSTDADEKYIGFVTIDESKFEKDKISYPKYINNNLVYKDHIDYKNYILYGEGSISDLLYFGCSTFDKFSVSYKYGNDSIEFISGAVKLRIKTNNLNIFNPTKYDGYSAILICCAGNNKSHETPIELIVDEINEEIALIYYVGLQSSELNITEKHVSGGIENLPHFSKLTDNEFNSRYFMIPRDNLSLSTFLDIYRDPHFTDQKMIFLNGSRNTNKYTEDKLKWGISDVSTGTDEPSTYNFIVTKNQNDSPVLISDGSKLSNNQSSVETYMYSESPADLFIKTDVNVSIINANEFENIINSNRIGLFVKSESGTKDLSNVENIISISRINVEHFSREDKKYKEIVRDGKSYSSAAEVIFKDMLSFNYKEDELSTIFEKSLDGCNIRLEDVRPVEQLFIKKYRYNDFVVSSDDENIDNTYDTGIVVHKGLNPLMNCFDKEDDIFKIVSDSSIISQNSLSTGYEKNTFIGSRGLALKTKRYDETIDYIEIYEWVESSTKSKKLISLNITSSIINLIKKSPGFKSIWKNINIDDITNESKYLENTILKFITVDETSIVKLFRKETGKKFKFNTKPTTIDGFDVVANFKSELYLLNGNFFLNISDLDDMYEYVAKLTIKL